MHGVSRVATALGVMRSVGVWGMRRITSGVPLIAAAVPVVQLLLFALQLSEVVYYTGMVGVVLNKEKFDLGLPCQRFFFGHTNDITAMAIHPNRQ